MISFDIHLKALAKRQLFIFCKLSYIDIIILKEFNLLIFCKTRRSNWIRYPTSSWIYFTWNWWHFHIGRHTQERIECRVTFILWSSTNWLKMSLYLDWAVFKTVKNQLKIRAWWNLFSPSQKLNLHSYSSIDFISFT